MARAGTERSEAQALVGRLRERREEIEQTILARVYAVSDPREVRDPDYGPGLREAVSAGLTYGLTVLEEGEAAAGSAPLELLAQARRAASSGVGLDTVLRRYFAGHTLLDDFIVQEAELAGRGGCALAHGALRAEAGVLDRLLEAVTFAYRDEVEKRSRSRHQRRAESVRRLLAGELAEMGALDYDLATWHVGAIAAGEEAEAAIAELAAGLGARILVVPGAEETLWSWLGSVRQPPRTWRKRLCPPDGVRIAFGEPGRGVGGWRLTHRQAAAAWPIASREPTHTVHYGDVPILASILQDEVLAHSLRDIYLAPLSSDRDGGVSSRRTLRAYFAAGCNVSSAASALGVNRNTVASRLRTIESSIGRPLASCAAEFEAALCLAEMNEAATPSGGGGATC